MGDKTIHDLLSDAREIYTVFGKGQRALTLVDQALALDPEHIDALNLKAAILYELDRDDEAAEYHRRVLTLQPCSVEALHGLASIANDAENYAEGLSYIERAFSCIATDPDPEFNENEDYRQRLLAELYNEKAFALWYLGKREEARHLLSHDAPAACPLEEETFADELDWLEEHPDNPDQD